MAASVHVGLAQIRSSACVADVPVYTAYAQQSVLSLLKLHPEWWFAVQARPVGPRKWCLERRWC